MRGMCEKDRSRIRITDKRRHATICRKRYQR